MMARKIAAFVLTLVLFALPALCLGEAAGESFLDKAYNAGRGVKTEITFLPGQALSQNPSMTAVADLLKALRVETFRQKQGGAAFDRIELFLQDKPSLSFTLLKDAEAFHVLSSLLKDQALSFSRAEYDHLLEFDPQSLQSDLAVPLTAWFGALASDAKTTCGTFESDKHDTAVMQTVYSLSADRISSFLKIIAGWAGKDVNLDRILVLASTPLAGGVTASRDAVRQAINELPETFLQKAAPALQEPATLTTWLDEDGAMKAVELSAKFSGTVLAAGQYVKTQEDGVTTLYSLNIAPEEARKADDMSTMFGMIAPEPDSLSVSFSVTDVPYEKQGDDAVTFSRWWFTCAVKGSGTDLGGIGLSFSGKTLTSAQSVKNDWTLNINARPYFGASLVCTEKCVMNGADAAVDGKLELYYLSGNQPTCTIAYTASSIEPEALPTLPKNSVCPLEMNPDELYAWWQETFPSVMEALTGAMENLPSSILAQLYGSAMPNGNEP